MKKSTKLLSIVLAVIMIFSTMGVAASAYGDYKNLNASAYDNNDNPNAALFTDEQRASIVMDLIDGFLPSLGIYAEVNELGGMIKLTIDLSSYNGFVNTLNEGLLGTAINMNLVGDLSDLDRSAFTNNSRRREDQSDVQALATFLKFVGDNRGLVETVLTKGSLDLGVGNGALAGMDLSILKDLPGMLGEVVYNLGARWISIGDDPNYPNDLAWGDSGKPTFDAMVVDLLKMFLTEPTAQTRITERSQNTLGYAALEETDEFGHTYYYCYGTNDDGSLKLTGAEKNKQYLMHWDESSALLTGDIADFVSANFFDLNGKSLYQMLETALPWAYDTFGAPNLDGQFRATLMQFCGAYNAAETDPAVQAQLKDKMAAYKALGPQGMSKKFAETPGDAGNNNFMYLSLDGAPISKDSKNLYYVVEWEGGYEFYKVDMSGVNAFFDMGDWEYQMGTWAEISDGWTAGTSVLAHLNNIVGNILVEAVPSVNWAKGGNDKIVTNLENLMKQFIKVDPEFIFGAGYTLPANFDSMDIESLAVMIAKIVMPWLMPALVLPEDVNSVEEVLVYGVREFTAEILPEYGKQWDAKIDEIKKLAGTAREDAFLDLALNMGLSVGAYYLRNTIGLGSYSGDKTEVPPMGPDFTWQHILNYIVDWALAVWLPGLSTYVKAQNAAAFQSGDALTKIGAILSALFPSIAKTIGMGSGTYAIDGNVVFNNLRAVLNGNFMPILTALERKSDAGAAGNMSIAKAVITVVGDLFGKLGLERSGSWSKLAEVLNNAKNSATPIQALLGNYGTGATIGKLAGGLLGCLADTTDIWVQDIIKIVVMFTSLTDTVWLDHASTWLDTYSYMGKAKADIMVSANMVTYGVADVYNPGVYKTGTTVIDPNYKMQVTSITVKDENGNIKAQDTAAKTVLNPGATGRYPISVDAPSNIGRWTVEVAFTVTTPAGEKLQMKEVKNILISSQGNDSVTPTELQLTDTINTSASAWGQKASSTLKVDLRFRYTNTYISEKQSLKEAEKVIFSFIDNSWETQTKSKVQHTWAKAPLEGYGTNVVNQDGSITINGGTGNLAVTKNSAAVSNLNDLWFKWNVSSTKIQTAVEAPAAFEGIRPDAQAHEQMWLVEDRASRSDYTDDFTSYKITMTLHPAVDYTDCKGGISLTYPVAQKYYDQPVTTYINLYNSYGLEDILNTVLGKDLSRAKIDFTMSGAEAAWAEYEAAFDNALNQLYGSWTAATFAPDHMVGGESSFKLAGERLTAAADALDAFKLAADTEEGTALDKLPPSDPKSPLHDAWVAVQAKNDMNLSNQDYVMYRWLKFYYTWEGINSYLNGAIPPAKAAYATLAGVPGEKVEAAVNAVAAEDLKALIEKYMKAEPTEEEKLAAEKAYADFEMPEFNLVQVAKDVSNMETSFKRMFAKYSAEQMKVGGDVRHYLNRAIADYGNVAAAGYTAESYARYQEALAMAKTVAAKADVQPSTLHNARYEFLIAYKALVKTDEAADYTVMKDVVERANDVLNNMANYKATAASGLTDEQAFAELLEALGYEVTVDGKSYIIGGDYTGVSAMNQEGTLKAVSAQPWVDGVAGNIEAALANIEPLVTEEPELVLSELGEETGVVIDRTSFCANGDGFIYGIDTDLGACIEDYLATPAGSIRVTENAMGMYSTGATIELLDDNGETVATYIFVFFGDVNGDGLVEAADLSLIDGVANYLDFDYMAGDGSAESMAMDINGDGLIEAADLSFYDGVANYLEFPSQAETAAVVAAGLGIA